ncbi:MAG: PIG-L family deacetylase [Bacteroidales bacterium]|nr:PIG-L family deacetylase [Bacteroidales bacterium]
MKNHLLMALLITSLLIYSERLNSQILVVIAPHPDDAEASCGGLIANAVAAGDTVIILTMTTGELGIGGRTQAEARAIRTEEAKMAAAVNGASVMFFGGIDGSLAADTTNTRKLSDLLLKINPDIVTATWPLDVHSDHQATGLLAWRVFLDQRFTFDLYFYETTNSPHSKSFQFVPTDYIDISHVINKKEEALSKHSSQGTRDWWNMYENLAVVRGYEADVSFAEAYIRARTFSGMGGRPGVTASTFVKQQ